MRVPVRALWPAVLWLQLTAAQHSRWEDRLAARVGRPAHPPPTPAAPREAQPAAVSSEAVRRELQAFVQEYVEPAIAAVRAHETLRGNEETCFATAGGQHLRYRCCVYFSALAAALLEWRFGNPALAGVPIATATHADAGGVLGAGGAVRDTRLLYRLLARWLLQPPPTAPSTADLRSQQLQAEAGADGYDLAALRAAASKLPGPLGRYRTPLTVLGVSGTLWRCEVSTSHSYLRFEPHAHAHEEVVIDVAFKQFLVMPEWMEARHFDACQSNDLLASLPDSFVGTHAQLEQRMTEHGLREIMRDVYETAGDPTHDAPFADAGELRRMHELRNLVMYATRDVALRRRLCGAPSQST